MFAQAQQVEDLQKTVASDRDNLEAAVENLRSVATDFVRAAKNHTHAKSFALNLVEEARTEAAHAGEQGMNQATDEFHSALKTLKTAPATGQKGAEKDAKQKSEHLEKLEEKQRRDARESLRRKLNAHKDEVRRSYNAARQAVSSLKKDRTRLETAQRRAGERESVYETQERRNEDFAEQHQRVAEQQKDHAERAIESIFDKAEDALVDKGLKDQEDASRARSKSVQQAVTAARQLAKSSEQDDASDKSAIELMESPMQNLSSTLKSFEKLDISEKADETAHESSQSHAKERTETEQQARKAVASDKDQLELSMQNMKKLAMAFQRAATSDAQTKSMAMNLVEEARTNAANAVKQEKDKATDDFSQALSTLKGSSAQGQEGAEKAARQKSKNLANLEKEEQRDARERLHAKRNAQKDEVRQSYRQAHEASMNLLRDRKGLMKAQRRAGEKESVYEKEEGMNEHVAERSQGTAESLFEQAEGSIEHVFERAEDLLLDQGQRDRENANNARHQAVQEAVATLRTARTSKKDAAVSDAIELMEEPSTTQTVQEAQDAVDSDKDKLKTALSNMENLAMDFRRASRTDREIKERVVNLVEEARTQAADAVKQKKGQAMDDFTKTLSTLKSATPTGNWSAMEKAAREKSENVANLEKEEQRDARDKLREKRDAQRDEVRRSYRQAHEAARSLVQDRKGLMDAQRRAGESESVYEREADRNQDFAERSEDRAQDQKERAEQALESVFERAEDRLLDQGINEVQASTHARRKAIQETVHTLREQASEEANEDASLESGLKRLQAGANERLIALVTDSSIWFPSAAASVGLLLFVMMRARVRPAPIVQPLLG